MQKKVEKLVVDTTAFINNVQLQEIADNLYTLHEVIEEVRCKRQFRNLVVLPYDLEVKDVDADCINFVIQFSKKTGDYRFLSATDIKLIALTYQLEKELGNDTLRTEPVLRKSIEPLLPNGTFKSPGFYTPDSSAKKWPTNEQQTEGEIQRFRQQKLEDNDEENHLQIVPEIDGFDDISQQFLQLTFNSNQPESDQVVAKCDNIVNGEKEGESGSEEVKEKEDEEEEGEFEKDCDEIDPCITDSDDMGWITPNSQVRRPLSESDSNAEKLAQVACYTTDFSMQNVLKQIGLNVIAKDGLLIRNINTYVLRCYACFQVVPQTARVFCPKCGNKTLKRVTVYVDDECKQCIKINFRRQITARGKKFPLPRPKGGKHAVNPILCEDQRIPQQRSSKLALTKNNPMHPDYIAGVSPFVMRDVSSRAAIIHANSKNDVKYWMRKNPNEVVKRRRKK